MPVSQEIWEEALPRYVYTGWNERKLRCRRRRTKPAGDKLGPPVVWLSEWSTRLHTPASCPFRAFAASALAGLAPSPLLLRYASALTPLLAASAALRRVRASAVFPSASWISAIAVNTSAR